MFILAVCLFCGFGAVLGVALLNRRRGAAVTSLPLALLSRQPG